MTEKKPSSKPDNAGKDPKKDANRDHLSLERIVGGENLSYDEFLEIKERSAGKVRDSFEVCYYEIPLGFKGEVEKRTRDKICFRRIFVEDHVWMDVIGLEDLKKGDCISFFAEVYCYLKTGNGKFIDFGLRNPSRIKIIEPYELPSDDDLMRQELRFIVCETCYLRDQCFGSCLLPNGVFKKKVDDAFRFIKISERKTIKEVLLKWKRQK